MEKPIYPSRYMRITQGYNVGTHIDSFAIDDGGKDHGVDTIYAPFTGIIKKIYQNDANEVWLESVEPVEYPDGTIDYMTIMFAHSNDISNLYVGKKIKQEEEFYKEGVKGNVTGNHCHIECGRGKFSGTGWYKNKAGYYSINNGKKPEECLWLNENIIVLDNNNYQFKSIENIEILENYKETTFPQETVENSKKNDLNLIFTCEKKDLYGIYLKEGQKLYLE